MLQERVQQGIDKTRAESEEVENVRHLLGNDRVLSELHLEERDVPGEPADDEDEQHRGEDDERSLVGGDRAVPRIDGQLRLLPNVLHLPTDDDEHPDEAEKHDEQRDGKAEQDAGDLVGRLVFLLFAGIREVVVHEVQPRELDERVEQRVKPHEGDDEAHASLGNHAVVAHRVHDGDITLQGDHLDVRHGGDRYAAVEDRGRDAHAMVVGDRAEQVQRYREQARHQVRQGQTHKETVRLRSQVVLAYKEDNDENVNGDYAEREHYQARVVRGPEGAHVYGQPCFVRRRVPHTLCSSSHGMAVLLGYRCLVDVAWLSLLGYRCLVDVD